MTLASTDAHSSRNVRRGSLVACKACGQRLYVLLRIEPDIWANAGIFWFLLTTRVTRWAARSADEGLEEASRFLNSAAQSGCSALRPDCALCERRPAAETIEVWRACGTPNHSAGMAPRKSCQ